MSRIKFIGLWLILITVSACSFLDPFVDRRREAGRPKDNLYVGSSKPDAPVICYNGWRTDFSEVQKMADDECIKHNTGVAARFEEKEMFACRILIPTKAKFECIR